jgi:hypothetical protein
MMLLLLLGGLVVVSEARAGRGPASDRIHPGHYSGGGFPSTPVDFGVSGDRRRVKNFKTRIVLSCKQNGRYVGDLTVRRIVFDKIPIQDAARGGRFIRTGHVRFRGGGHLQVRVRGILIAPERARGYLTGHARLPDDITCRPFFGPIDWRARYVG